METEYQYLLHLLGAYLREEELEAPENIDWEKITRLAQIHCVTGILGYMSMKYPICPDAQLKAALRSTCLNTIACFARRNVLAETMVAELEKAGIDHILMKGYVLRDYYPVPELRTFGDIDIVIRPEDRQRSHELMLSLGYHVETDWEPVFSYAKEQELYEIHTDVMEIDVSEKADYRAYFQQMWQYAQPVSGHSYRFTPEFHFLYMLTHIAKHIHGSGAGARMYLDVAAFVWHYGAGVDWGWIREQLEELKLYDFASVVLTAAEEWFGITSPLTCKPIDSRVMEEFRTFTMEAGVFGHFGRDSGTIALKSQGQGKETVSRADTFIKRLFPSAHSIEKRYTYLQSKPWLLPAAWIHRLFITKDTWRLHAEEARSIFTVDTEQVLQMRNLYKKIGL